MMKAMKKYRSTWAAALLLAGAMSLSAFAYDADKVDKYGLVRSDLATWTQRKDSFPENGEVSINGSSPLSTMGCSYYATFFMLCRMGIKDPLTDTAWEFALECKRKKLSRDGTGYFDPRSISRLTGGRVRFVEEGNYENYYDGQSGAGKCESQEDMYKFLRRLTEKGYFLIACAVGNVTNYQDEEYYSEGHYVYIDSVGEDDMVIGDSAFPGTRWSDNWGAGDGHIVKVYAYKLLDESGKMIKPSERQSMYVKRSEDED